jgi:hypothetical protein
VSEQIVPVYQHDLVAIAGEDLVEQIMQLSATTTLIVTVLDEDNRRLPRTQLSVVLGDRRRFGCIRQLV